MPAIQTTFNQTMAKGIVGRRVNSEEWNTISRSNESATAIKFGAPVARGAADGGCIPFGGAVAMTATGGNGVPPPVAATIGTLTAVAPAQIGVYQVRCIVGGSGNAAKWEVTAPDGSVIGTATSTVAFSAGGIGFTIADPGTDPLPGETFTVTVSATGGADADFLGIAEADMTLNAPTTGHPQYATVPVMESGVIWVTAGGTVKQGQPARFDSADGRYVNDAVSATVYALPGCEFDSGGADGELVKLRVRRQPVA